MDANVYDKQGKQLRTVTLPDELFGLPWNADLVHQVVTSMQANAREVIAHTKDRSEVRGGGKKPWKQKGTGRARHGSRRSPIWRHGGITFGPRNEKIYTQKINKKMRTKALFTVLSKKLRDGEVLFIDDFAMTASKTKDAQVLLDGLATVHQKINYRKGSRALIALPARNEAHEKSFRNIPSVLVEEVRNLNPVELLSFKYVVLVGPDESLKELSVRKR
ncbi:MAG: 50S ribosomal protein L4 [bacterium]|nr:50S ribosomal protein L4 [bacterium]